MLNRSADIYVFSPCIINSYTTIVKLFGPTSRSKNFQSFCSSPIEDSMAHLQIIAGGGGGVILERNKVIV